MPMQFENKQTSGVERRVQVSVPADDVRDAEERAARRYASKVRLPGFRPGKAPAAIVKQKFGDAIRQEAIEAIVRDAYKEVIEKTDLKLASQPHVHGVAFETGKPLTFELHFEVRPSIELARTGGFRITRDARPVSDEDVAQQLERLRVEKAAWSPVERKPQPGDMVRIMLTSADAGQPTPPDAEPREYTLILGSGQAIAGIEEVIMQAAPGETVERSVHWPDDFPDEAERGKTKSVRVTVVEAKQRELPPLDDALAREAGDFDSLDALRAAVRQDLEHLSAREADATVRNQLVDQIVSANSFDIPPSWVDQLAAQYMEAYGVGDADRERFTAEFRPIAERQVRRDLVIETIAAREKLEASEKDLDDRIAKIAEQRSTEPGKIYASLEKAGRLKEIERGITEEKVFEWLLARNEIENARA